MASAGLLLDRTVDRVLVDFGMAPSILVAGELPDDAVQFVYDMSQRSNQ